MKPRSLSLEMFQYAAAPLALSMLVGLLPAAAHAAPPPSGTISCDVAAVNTPKKLAGFQFRPFINGTPGDVVVKATNSSSTCDNSNVVDGKAPIVGVGFKVVGRMLDATCTTFTSTPSFQKAKVQLKWRGLNPAGHPMTVAVNNLRIASSSYDSGTHAVILVTEPIVKGAFVGKTATLHLGLTDPTRFEEHCVPETNYLGTVFGDPNPSTVVVE